MNKILVLLSLPVLGALGCAHTSRSAMTPVTPATSTSAASSRAQLDANERTAANDECTSTTVHFALDSAQLTDADEAALRRGARCLESDRSLHVVIAGNTDERGTEEYNLSLGDRRATSTMHYLEALGVPNAQLKTVSYGKESPVCDEHDEACWSKNRRADLKLASAQR